MAAVGRPTLYCEEILAKTKDYLQNFQELGDPVPTIAGLSCELGISRETIYQWAKDEDKCQFSDMLGTLMAKQERILAGKGLSGEFNPNITKMMITKHGYSDKQDVNLGGQAGNPVDMSWTVTFVNAEPESK